MVHVTRSRVDLLGSDDRPLRRSPTTRSSLDILLVFTNAQDESQPDQWRPFAELGYYPLETEFRGPSNWFPIDAIRA